MNKLEVTSCRKHVIPLYLNNKLFEMGSMLSEILKICDDLSDISFSDIMNHIEPTVWKFFTILPCNYKNQLFTFRRSFDFTFWQ